MGNRLIILDALLEEWGLGRGGMGRSDGEYQAREEGFLKGTGSTLSGGKGEGEKKLGVSM